MPSLTSRFIDLGYAAAALLGSPLWLPRMVRTGKVRTDWRARFGHGIHIAERTQGRSRLMLHAVSVGEVNAIRELIATLETHPGAPELVIASTTDTGFTRAQSVFGRRHSVIRFPFDFSGAVSRVLDAVRPDAVALIELEVWPNFVALCARRGIPVGVVNGRLTERSFRRYRRIRPLVRPTFHRLSFVAAQNEAYAQRFEALGVAADRIHITGTMKWDTARIEDTVPGAEKLREALGIDPNRPLIVAGSTAPGEHELLHASVPAGVQLLCAPRKPEWFDRAAAVLRGCARRSRGDRGSKTDRFLLDTIGDLRAAYALADLVIVGRTFVDLGGSDMIEPVALDKATIIGPYVSNFEDSARVLREGGGVVQCDAASLQSTIAALLSDPTERAALADRGRTVIRRHQGVTARTAELLLNHLPQSAMEQR